MSLPTRSVGLASVPRPPRAADSGERCGRRDGARVTTGLTAPPDIM